MIISAGCGIITRMDISVLATTNDIEQLRAMVQNTVSENAKNEEKLRQQNTSLQQRILLLEEMLKLARQQRFGKKGETLAGMQRSLFEEDADIAAVEAQLDTLLPVEEKTLRTVLRENRSRCIFRESQKRSNRPQPKAALTARVHCVTSVMKWAKSWNISLPASR